MNISPGTQYILSTSGRTSSINRYNKLLQEILKIPVVYLPISAHALQGKIQPDHFVQAINGLGAIGGAISKDIKHKVVPFLDELDPLAKEVNSVNTVIRNDTGLKGYNTDVHGFDLAIRSGISKSGISVNSALVYGYGGVFQVVFHVLKKMGVHVFVTGRNEEKIIRTQDTFNLEQYQGQPVDLFVNATPVSNHPLDREFKSLVDKAKLVFDHEMPGQYLLDYCKTKRLVHISGYEMYYPQMYRQWSLFLKGYAAEEDIPRLISLTDKN